MSIITNVLQACVAKAKKMPKTGSETKAEIEAFEAKLEATATERREEQQAARQDGAEASEEEEVQDMDAGRACIAISSNGMVAFQQHTARCLRCTCRIDLFRDGVCVPMEDCEW